MNDALVFSVLLEELVREPGGAQNVVVHFQDTIRSYIFNGSVPPPEQLARFNYTLHLLRKHGYKEQATCIAELLKKSMRGGCSHLRTPMGLCSLCGCRS